jgi:hypothetical protein
VSSAVELRCCPMSDEEAIDALVVDLQWQIDEMRPRGIKNKVGQPYNPSYYKRGLESAIDRGGVAVAEYVRGYLDKPPSGTYQKLEEVNALDLACEWLVADPTRPYAHLFSEADRAAARARLAPHIEAIEQRQEERRARMAAATERVRAKGLPRRWELDASRHSRRSS